jgi:hypothetical protein
MSVVRYFVSWWKYAEESLVVGFTRAVHAKYIQATGVRE